MFSRRNHAYHPSELPEQKILYDKTLLFTAIFIIAIGLLMVASASIVVSEQHYGWGFHYFVRQLIYVVLGAVIAGFIFFIKVETLERISLPFLMIIFVLLFLVLVPGIGRHVNGSARWLGAGPIMVQVSELAKFAIVIYLASYLTRRQKEVRYSLQGFIKPMAVMGVAALFLLAEPDFGATVVIVATGLSMMFMAGVRLRQFGFLLLCVIVLLVVIAIASPYRLERLTTFLNPWAYQYSSGYQLTQSLIAFGRGGWSGVGLGDSIQKLYYLPEAHTDFLFAILVEELGLIGALLVIVLYSVMIFRALMIARSASLQQHPYAALTAFGFAIWLGIQFVVNIGVNAGLLPTKGLTLPLMSYGGSSLVVDMAVIAFLLRIDYETRLSMFGIRDVSELYT